MKHGGITVAPTTQQHNEEDDTGLQVKERPHDAQLVFSYYKAAEFI